MFDKIPTTIITGFLGSGKTSLLRHLLRKSAGKRIAVIVNEFGELGIDGELLRCPLDCEEAQPAQDLPIYELANGCICCTVQEEFFPVMEHLITLRGQLDYIIIETSGLALPKPLVQAFQWPQIKQFCTVDAVITVVDAPAVASGMFAADPQAVLLQRQADPNLDHESPMHELFEDQLFMADLVIVNKTDLVDTATLAQVHSILRLEINPKIKIIDTQYGKVHPEIILGFHHAVEDQLAQRQSHHDSDHEDDHDHDFFQSFHFKLPQMLQDTALKLCQHLIANHTIIRLKGFIGVPDKPMRLVMQAVGERIDSYFDRRWHTHETPASVLVVIGPQLNEAAVRLSIDRYLSAACIS